MKIIIFASLFVTNLLSQTNINLDCFTIVAGKNTTVDGSTIVAHNEDDFGKQIVNLYKTSSEKNSPNEKIELANGGTVSQVSKTNGFIWFELPGMKVADSFINDKGVVITSNGCPSREENPDSTDGGILYWLRRIVAERAKSSKEAVKIAGNLIDKYGYVSSGRTYTFADKDDTWIFSAVYGKHWIAQRVPDNEVAVIPNYYTIGQINLQDTANFLGSPDIVSHAINSGWYSPDSNIKFNFAKAYTALSSINHPGNIHRIWRGINLLSKEDFSIDKEFPFSFVPYKKLDIQDIMAVLKDHYEGCELDKSKLYKNGNPHKENNATICSGSTQYSFISQLRKDLPPEIGVKVWLTFFRPGAHIYAPIYLGIQQIPSGFSLYNYEVGSKLHLNPPDSTFDYNDSLAYWDFVSAVGKIDEDFEYNYPAVRNQNNFLENKIIKENLLFENGLLLLYKRNPQDGLLKLNEYSKERLMEIWNRAIEISK